MADPTEDDRASLAATLADRRRPGRVDYQNAQLIPLLRGDLTHIDPVTAEMDAVSRMRWVDDLSPARGILVAVLITLIGATIWAVTCLIWHYK